MRPDTRVLLGGLAFPEAPRWRDGRLWLSDQHAGAVIRVTPQGRSERVALLHDRPGGLGWLADGTPLVVAMGTRRLYRLKGGDAVLHSDLSGLAPHPCNDMLVDDRGRAYVGHFGYDLHGGAPPAPAALIRVEPDGRASVEVPDLVFPNGCVLTPDGGTLILAETFAHRLTAFRRDRDGGLTGRRLWAPLGEATPDGICLDAEGAVWVASPGTAEVLRVREGGEVVSIVHTRGTPYACMLGGPGRDLLYVMTSETDDPAEAARTRSGRVETLPVAVPGAGLP
ncbi:MAG: SMP-30/gluconolactonase/LRE family protein [Chromatiales bacterium]